MSFFIGKDIEVVSINSSNQTIEMIVHLFEPMTNAKLGEYIQPKTTKVGKYLENEGFLKAKIKHWSVKVSVIGHQPKI